MKSDKFENLIITYFTIPITFAWYEIKSKYYRSKIGPFWITLSTLVTISGLSFVFYSIFNIPLKETIPWISCGIITWVYISTVIDESTSILIDGSLLEINISLFEIVLRNTYKNFIILFHNIIILIPVSFVFGLEKNLSLLYIFYGLLILFANSMSFSIVFGLLCLRYRDYISIIKSLLYLVFLMTPIFWMPTVLTNNRKVLVDVNPVYQIIQTIRDPFLGNPISSYGFYFTIIFTFICGIIAFYYYRKFSKVYRIWI